MSSSNLPDDAQDFDGQDEMLEQAIAEFLIAEDSGAPFNVEAWLERHALVRGKLLVFLSDNRLTKRAAGARKRSTASLDETSVYFSPDSHGTDNLFSDLDTPKQIGGFRLIKLIGQGGMGRVYEVQDEQQHKFALKLISPQFATSAEAMQRFRQEGAIASSINHPRCVFVHSADQIDGRPYIAMELMSGATLRDLVRKDGPLRYREAVAKIIDVIDGLQAAHDRGLIHRDVKPSNCYLESDGRVKVGDFGLARQIEGASELTQTGAVVGTPLFASPEQLLGSPLDIRTDVYSVSATLYYLLTGRAPFEHNNPLTVIARSMAETPTPIRSLANEIPTSLEQTILHGLRRNPEERIPDLQELRSQLDEYLPGTERIRTLGLRFLAYMVDVGVFSIAALIVAFCALGWGETTSVTAAISVHVAVSISQWAYFFLSECFFGATIGKWLVGVKVQVAAQRSPPGWWRCFLRTTIWLCFGGILSDLFLYTMVGIEVNAGVSVWQWMGYIVLHSINSAPLLWRSDQRLLHEVLSGTEVKLVPERKARQSPIRDWPTLVVAPSDQLPWKRLGRFEVVGAMMELKGTRWYLGTDPTLNRAVWIATRNRNAPDVSAKRRACARTTRLRWVASGNHVGVDVPIFKWDVFLAPDSASVVSQLQQAQVSMDWSQTRFAIKGIVDEFEASRRDGLDIPPCELDFIQVKQDGTVVWIDDLGDNIETDSKQSSKNDEEQDVLQLAHSVASTLLSLRPANEAAHTAHPLYVTNLLSHFTEKAPKTWTSVGELCGELNKVRNRPSFVNLPMRLIQVVTQATLSLAAFGAVLSLLGVGYLSQLDRCESILLRVEAVRYVLSRTNEFDAALESPSPLFSPKDRDFSINQAEKCLRTFAKQRDEAASCFWKIDTTTRSSYGDVLLDKGLIALLRPKVTLGEKILFEWQLPESIPTSRSSMNEPMTTTPEMNNAFAKRATFSEEALVDTLSALESDATVMAFPKRPRFLVIAFMPWVVAVLWGVFWRGGISRWLAGIAIVDSSGRLAPRWRLCIRSILLWSPFGLLILAMIVPPLYGYSNNSLVTCLRALYFALPMIYLAAGLLSAPRMPHEKISGTWAVPK